METLKLPSKKAIKEQERQERIEFLRDMIKPGDKVYCVLRHVSKSGMSRCIELMIIKDSELLTIGYGASKAMGYKYCSDHNGIKVGGCGMDMGFELVYNLGRTLFPNGGPVDLSQRAGQEKRDGKTIETDGGYLLRHIGK